MTRSTVLLAALALLWGCASAPKIALPSKAEANCENRAVKQTAIGSIVASIDDTVRPGTYPGDGALRRVIRSTGKDGGGVFAYWPNQPLYAPDTAKALGVTGDYLVLTRAAITNQIDAADHWRPVWLTFTTPRGSVTVLERAYDIQNVCIEGQRDV
ncbi:MAG TPA: hypothetical protein VGN14_19120 [Candidatus Elarobacter sp.]